MKNRKGPIGTVIWILSILFFFGIFLAVLSQFDGDLGALFKWLLELAWGFVVDVRDTVASWDTFQGLF